MQQEMIGKAERSVGNGSHFLEAVSIAQAMYKRAIDPFS